MGVLFLGKSGSIKLRPRTGLPLPLDSRLGNRHHMTIGITGVHRNQLVVKKMPVAGHESPGDGRIKLGDVGGIGRGHAAIR